MGYVYGRFCVYLHNIFGRAGSVFRVPLAAKSPLTYTAKETVTYAGE